VLLVALLANAAGCYPMAPYPMPVPPPEYWRPTDYYSTTDWGLRLVVLSFGFEGKGGLWYCTLFHAVLAPEDLSGWQVTPGLTTISDNYGTLGAGRFVSVASAGSVTLGALAIPPFRGNADALYILFDKMEAENLATGQIEEFQGIWRVMPLINRAPDQTPAGTLAGDVSPESVQTAQGGLELTYQSTRLRYSTVDLRGSGPPNQPYWDHWVVGQQFWFSEPVPHDVFVLVTSEGEVSSVSADEYTQKGFRVYTLW
jgi:hypothetical protein